MIDQVPVARLDTRPTELEIAGLPEPFRTSVRRLTEQERNSVQCAVCERVLARVHARTSLGDPSEGWMPCALVFDGDGVADVLCASCAPVTPAGVL